MALEAVKEDVLTHLPVWKAEYEKLGKLIAAAEEFVGETVSVPSNGGTISRAPRGPRPTIRPDEFTGMTTSKAVLAYLDRMGKGNPQGPRDIARALVDGGRDSDETKAYANVVSALKRMKKTREIWQVRRGQWGLTSWYASSVPTRKSEPKRNGEADKGGDDEAEA